MDSVVQSKQVGFSYKCPHCYSKSFVSTVYIPTHWACINCSSDIPLENITMSEDMLSEEGDDNG